MAKVMAVILNYNSIDDTKKCVAFLKKQNNVSLQICIVDNNSTDGKVEELKAFGEANGCIVICNTKNGGYSAGNNIGLKRAAEENFDYAIIINPDVEVRDEDYVQKALAKLEEDKNVVVLGTDIVNMDNQHQNPLKEMNFFKEVFFPVSFLSGKIGKKVSGVGNYKKSGYCEKVSGCIFFISVPFIKEQGYLDENVFLFCEESILGKMVKNANKKMYYYADATAFHQHSVEEKEVSAKKWKIFIDSRKYYLKNYSGYKGLRLKLAIKSKDIQYRIHNK